MSKKKKNNKQDDSQQDEVKIVIVNRISYFTSKFKEDLAWWFRHDFQKASKIMDLITAVVQDRFEGIGKPEPLKYLEADIWSRRINLEHRLTYRVTEAEVYFLTCRYHYE